MAFPVVFDNQFGGDCSLWSTFGSNMLVCHIKLQKRRTPGKKFETDACPGKTFPSTNTRRAQHLIQRTHQYDGWNADRLPRNAAIAHSRCLVLPHTDVGARGYVVPESRKWHLPQYGCLVPAANQTWTALSLHPSTNLAWVTLPAAAAPGPV